MGHLSEQQYEMKTNELVRMQVYLYTVFIHAQLCCIFVVENCNGLKEESAGKTAEVAFFLLLYRKQLEIAGIGIGIKHIRACSLLTLPSRQ